MCLFLVHASILTAQILHSCPSSSGFHSGSPNSIKRGAVGGGGRGEASDTLEAVVEFFDAIFYTAISVR